MPRNDDIVNILINILPYIILCIDMSVCMQMYILIHVFNNKKKSLYPYHFVTFSVLKYL